MVRSGKGGGVERAVTGARLTPVDVQQVQFRLAFRGYNERDVDTFLDRVTEDLTARIEERDRLIRQLEAGGGRPSGTTGDVAAARAEAEAILAAARAEAQEIIRRAHADAGAAAGTTPGDARAALAPFLAREREFLTRLGAIVQSHAEDIRGMVQERRGPGGAEPRG